MDTATSKWKMEKAARKWRPTSLLNNQDAGRLRKEALVPYVPPPWANHLRIIPKNVVEMAILPTEIQTWHLPTEVLPEDFTVLIKRDDKTGIGLSGNKVRKLQFLMAEAIELNCDCVVTIGGVQSNHCRATAVAATRLGMESFLVLRQLDTILEQTLDPGLNGNLLLSRMAGANLSMVSKSEYVQNGQDRLLVRQMEKAKEAGKEPYGIPVGGSTPLGCWGYIEFVRELKQQLEEAGDHISDIVVACGSGGSAAGIALGVKLAGLDCRVHAITVCDDRKYFIDHIQGTLNALGTGLKADDLLVIHTEYKGKGYALSTEQELKTILEVAHSTGIMCDPVYSGKALSGLLDLLQFRRDQFKGKKVLFVHTGGLYGMYDKMEALQPLLEEGKVSRLFAKL